MGFGNTISRSYSQISTTLSYVPPFCNLCSFHEYLFLYNQNEFYTIDRVTGRCNVRLHAHVETLLYSYICSPLVENHHSAVSMDTVRSSVRCHVRRRVHDRRRRVSHHCCRVFGPRWNDSYVYQMKNISPSFTIIIFPQL